MPNANCELIADYKCNTPTDRNTLGQWDHCPKEDNDSSIGSLWGILTDKLKVNLHCISVECCGKVII